MTSVRFQLYVMDMMSADMTMESDCRKAESLSEMPACTSLAVIVMIAAAWPGGRMSRVDTGWRKRHLIYSSLMAADILKLDIRKPI